MTSKIHAQVKEDLKHIPRREKNSPQNYFRQHYSAVRLSDLSKSSLLPKSITLKCVTKWMRKTRLNFVPSFNKDYFGIKVSEVIN